MKRTNTPPERDAAHNKRPEAAFGRGFRRWVPVLLVVAVILLLLGTGLFPGSGSPGGTFSWGWTLLILLVLLPCMLMPFMMRRHHRGDAERDRKDDGHGS